MTGFSTDPDIRHNGSSGGIISAIAQWLVDSGDVDGVIATYYDPHFPIGTESRLVSTPSEAAFSAGSKYSPASPLAILAQLREAQGRFAVIGKPCDIATLRRAMAADDKITEKIAYLISFYCAGTPSDNGNRSVLEHLGAPPPEDLASFRHRGDGWPGRTRAIGKDGTQKSCTYGESWGTILRSHTHNLCIICPDGIGEQADLVAADAWYGDEKGYPVFEEADGRSLVMTRTAKGSDLLKRARAAGVVQCQSLDVREIDSMQPGQWKRRRELALRVAAYRMLGRKTPTYNRRALKAYQRGMSVRDKIAIFYGTLRRVARTLFRKE
jgi:coenzyme F420 hydrogenase subunit beta